MFKNRVKSFQIFPLIEDQENSYLAYFVIKKKGTMRQKSQKSLCRFVLSCYVFILLYEKSYVSWALVPLYCLLLVIVIIIVILVNIDILGQFSFI